MGAKQKILFYPKPFDHPTIYHLFIYLFGFYVAFNTVQVISRRVVQLYIKPLTGPTDPY